MAAKAVVSGAIFDGYDTTNRSASNIEIFRVPSNHAAATASILVYSAELTSFSPATQEPNFEKTINEKLEDPNTARALRGPLPDNVQDQLLTEWTLSLIVLSKREDYDIVSFKLDRVALAIHSDEASQPTSPSRRPGS
ncbi:hypothetical protein BGX30_001914 [Mortierella sp. GBA39]|nr:hypothetical protein BGX30_001914 [Mortierella sp. GBA39]